MGQLDDKYKGGDQLIADQTIKAREVLKDKGVSESLRNIMEGMNQVLPPDAHNQQYAGILALYITMRDN